MTKYKDICQEIRVEPPPQKLLKNNAKFICKIMYEKRVQQILDLMIINPRIGTQVYMVDPHKNNSKSAIIRHVQPYNTLPLDIKILNSERLKRKLAKLQVSFKD